MSTKSFYDRNAEEIAEPLDVAAAGAALRQPGNRYFCVPDQLPDASGLRAVELGFGSVSRATLFAGMFGEFEAADISATRLLGGQSVGFAWRDADLDQAWPFVDGSLDVVIAMMVFEHLFDPFHSFAELARVLRPGGLAFVNLPNIGSVKCRFDLLRGRMPVTSNVDWFEKRQWDGGHLHYFTIDEVRRVAALNGLGVRRIYPVGRFVGLKRLWPGLLCHEISYVFEKAPARG
ncbi:MAG: methyltransferase domain-containing protein [Rhodospirillaceae bacterium]